MKKKDYLGWDKQSTTLDTIKGNFEGVEIVCLSSGAIRWRPILFNLKNIVDLFKTESRKTQRSQGNFLKSKVRFIPSQNVWIWKGWYGNYQSSFPNLHDLILTQKNVR